MSPSHSLTFLWTPFGVIAGALAVLGAMILGWIAWRRSGFARGTGILEGTRLLAVAAVAATLNQPEWRELYLPDGKPTVAVLWDASGSMDTRDVIDPSDPNRPPLSRLEWIQPLVERERWEQAAKHLDVVIEPFSRSERVSSDPSSRPSSMESPPREASRGTDLAAALTGVLERHGNLRGVVLLSDGDWNTGDPPARAAARLGMKNVPVFALGAGSESRLPDIELVRLDVPTFAVAGKPMRIPFHIESALTRDHRATVTLRPSSGEEVTTEVLVPAMSRVDDSILWRPEEVGDLTLTMRVTPSEDELTEENNERTVPIAIREETLKVLLVESRPRWEYRYLRNALERDPGVEVSCLLFHPDVANVGGGKGYLAAFPAAPELARYDVVFLGDVGVGEGELTQRECAMIKGLVRSQAGGLILMPGLRGRHHSLMATDLDELYPVVLDATQPRGWGSREPARFELTETGRRSLLTKLEDDEDENARLWEDLPGFQWYAAVLRAKAGTEVLATHRSETSSFGRIPLLVTRTFGTGKVLFMGTDGAWRWREGVEDRYHYRFWGQVARWMAYQRNMAQGESMRLFYAPDRPRAGDVVTLSANVMSAGGEPLEAGTVVVEVAAPSGKVESVRLAPSADGWGLFSGRFSPREHGRYRMALRCLENPSSVETSLSVESVVRERIGRPARLDVLEEIAAISRGRMVDPDGTSALVDEIAALSRPEPLVRRLKIWCHPLWAGCLVVMLGALWIGRKMVGVI